MKKNKCIDCGKSINPLAKRCKSCSHKGKLHPLYGKKRTKEIIDKIRETKRAKNKEKNTGNYIDGRTLKKGKCLNCGKTINYYRNKSHLCIDCSNKSRNYKGKKTIKHQPYYCIDCDKKIHYHTALYGQGRCRSCSSKGKNFKGDKAVKRQIHICNEKKCNNIISYRAWKCGGGRCLSCASKNIWQDEKYRENHSGKKHHMYGKTGKLAANYIDGSSFEPYPFGWTKTFKEQIRYRDGYKCQLCGKPEVENGRKLDVHHIDYKKTNLNLNNLISLCKSCHMKTNGNRKYWKKYYKEKINN